MLKPLDVSSARLSFVLNVVPLISCCLISDELNSVGNKRMKSSGFGADVANDDLAIFLFWNRLKLQWRNYQFSHPQIDRYVTSRTFKSEIICLAIIIVAGIGVDISLASFFEASGNVNFLKNRKR